MAQQAPNDGSMRPSWRLSTDEMREAMVVFKDCQQTVQRDISEDGRTMVNKWIESTVCTMNPSYSLRPDVLEEFNDTIFQSPTVSQFVFDLAFRFFTLWGDDDNAALRLSGNFAQGLMIDGPVPDLSTIPESIVSSMLTTQFNQINAEQTGFWQFFKKKKSLTVEEFLCSNKHLLVVYMLYLINTNVITAQ